MLFRRVGPTGVEGFVDGGGGVGARRPARPTGLQDRDAEGRPADVPDLDGHRVRGPAHVENVDERARERLRDDAGQVGRRGRDMCAAHQRQRAAGGQDDRGRHPRPTDGRRGRLRVELEDRAPGRRRDGAVAGGGRGHRDRGRVAGGAWRRRRRPPPSTAPQPSARRRRAIGAVVARVVHVPGSGLGRGPGQRVGRAYATPATQQAHHHYHRRLGGPPPVVQWPDVLHRGRRVAWPRRRCRRRGPVHYRAQLPAVPAVPLECVQLVQQGGAAGGAGRHGEAA